jgi:hypothetical protein
MCLSGKSLKFKMRMISNRKRFCKVLQTMSPFYIKSKTDIKLLVINLPVREQPLKLPWLVVVEDDADVVTSSRS